MKSLRSILKFKILLRIVLEGKPSEEQWTEFDRLLQTGRYYKYLSSEQFEQVATRYQAKDGDPEGELVEDAYKQILPTLEPEKARSIPFYKSPVVLAAAASISFAIVFGLWFIAKDQKWIYPVASSIVQDQVAYEGKKFVSLPDGTKIVLNESSKLSYQEPFGITNREVMLEGEATFEVAHDQSRPFLVHTGKIITKVLGTEFNINAYAIDEEITVTVLKGLVEVREQDRVLGQVRPNEQIAINVHTLDVVKEETDADDAVQWKANFIILDNIKLEEAVAIISKKFNVKFIFENPELKNCRIIGSFLNNEPLETVLSLISSIVDIQYTVDKSGNVILKGKGCNASNKQ